MSGLLGMPPLRLHSVRHLTRADMFSGLDEVTFREDLSSTTIRQGTADPGL